MVGEDPGRLGPAPAPAGDGPVLGYLRFDLGQVHHLPGQVADPLGVIESGPAGPARAGPVFHDLIRGGRHLQRLTPGPTLLAPPAFRLSLRALRPLLGLALAFRYRIARRRLARVPRVLPQASLKLIDTSFEPLYLLGLCLDQPGQLLVRGRTCRLVSHIESPATSTANREHPRRTNALVTRDFQKFLRGTRLSDLNSYSARDEDSATGLAPHLPFNVGLRNRLPAVDKPGA